MRRWPLPIACALLGATLWVAAPALSRSPYVPRAVDFEQAPALPAAKAAVRGGALLTAPIRAPRRFDLLGLRWPGHDRPAVWLRVRRDGESWSGWVRADSDRGHGPDGGSEGGGSHGGGSDPVWAGGANVYQLRLSRPVPGLRVHFVNTTGTATSADRLRTALRRAAHSAFIALLPGVPAARATVPGQPPIIPRASWGASQCPPRAGPSYGRVSFAIVHHTDNANTYGPQDSAAIVLAICRFHRNSRGWNDIGYNFLVDRYGQIFEGRAGGIANAVLGAQAQGYNSYSTGIANIGEFTSGGQTAAGVSALERLLAWKLALHGVTPYGTVAVGGRVFNHIAGHRDANSTDCPGDALYAQLPEIRAVVARLSVAGGLTIAAPLRRLRYPATTRLGGRLLDDSGDAVGGATVEVQARTATGAFVTVGRASTDAAGNWNAALQSSRSGTYRAHWDGDNLRPAFDSPPLRVAVAPLVSIRPLPRIVTAGRYVTVLGTVGPAKRLLSVVVLHRVGRAYRFFTRRTALATAGRFRVSFRASGAGLYRAQAYFRGDPVNAPIASGYAFASARPSR